MMYNMSLSIQVQPISTVPIWGVAVPQMKSQFLTFSLKTILILLSDFKHRPIVTLIPQKNKNKGRYNFSP